MTGLARALGLVVGYVGVNLAIRVADVVDEMQREYERQQADAAAAEDEAIKRAAAAGG